MSEPPVQTKQMIEQTLAAAGLAPDRHLGQHFLIDGNLMRKLVASAEIAPGDAVLEVGGGTGGLTDLLAAAASRVIVVEVDHDLAPLLQKRYADQDHVTVLYTDVLKNKHTIAPQVLDTLQSALDAPHTPDVQGPNRAATVRERSKTEDAHSSTTAHRAVALERPGNLTAPTAKLVANLPYHVATPLIMNLLIAEPRVTRMCFTIQKEVADRLTTDAGRRDFGPLAIAVQTTCTITKLAKLLPPAFWPPPKVASSMLRLDRKPHSFEQAGQLQRYFDLIHAAFAHRRKTVRYNLARHLSETQLEKALSIVNGNDRAERIPLAQWIELGRTCIGE